ncbi:hypothetical protein [Caballeronia sp. LZ035]|uniref:hypothetical protein n=1 Tax=Caballeronia sp. LZ035 TaxID=3038568 RepID=UPI0028583198|nr:hypothetical protein [Caballeronia sp. LZ035]MDR5761249.1 hypothetical protein [Caballeronia sp. LZ035]
MPLHSVVPLAKVMYILGQMGAIICHERGPSPQTSVLTRMASRPAEGLADALAEMNALGTPRRGHRRALLQWKHAEILRLRRMLPDALPAAASAHTQMPFWAGYCQYWEEILKAHTEPDGERPVLRLVDTSRKHPDA